MGTALVKKIDIDKAAKEINTAFRAGIGDAVKGFIAAGKLLKKHKDELPHGSFETLVQTKLDFTPRTAQYLMTIVDHAVLSNAKHVSFLPPSWGTLAQLARVSEAKLLKAIESGAVHPGMERDDVKALLPKPKPKPKLEEDEEEDEDDNAEPAALTPEQSLAYAMTYVNQASSYADNLKEFLCDDRLTPEQMGVLSKAIQSLVRKWTRLIQTEED